MLRSCRIFFVSYMFLGRQCPSGNMLPYVSRCASKHEQVLPYSSFLANACEMASSWEIFVPSSLVENTPMVPVRLGHSSGSRTGTSKSGRMLVPVRPRTGTNGVPRGLFVSRMGEELWSRFVSRTGTDGVELWSRFVIRTGTDVSQIFHNFQKFQKMV